MGASPMRTRFGVRNLEVQGVMKLRTPRKRCKTWFPVVERVTTQMGQFVTVNQSISHLGLYRRWVEAQAS